MDPSNGWKSLELLCEYFAENKTFYQNALTVQGQNSFFEYFGDMLKTVSAANLDALLDDGQHHDFYITFFSDAFRSVIMRWLIEGAQIPPSEFVRLLKNAITGFAYKVTCEVDSRESD